MTPMREDAPVAWREASVATVSIYGQGKEGSERRDTCYLARTPDGNMKTLLEQVGGQVVRARRDGTLRDFVLPSDGRDAVWSASSNQPVLHGVVWSIDFYHAAENLMKAAVAIYGEGRAAKRWHERLRGKMLLEENAVDNMIRTMRRC